MPSTHKTRITPDVDTPAEKSPSSRYSMMEPSTRPRSVSANSLAGGVCFPGHRDPTRIPKAIRKAAAEAVFLANLSVSVVNAPLA